MVASEIIDRLFAAAQGVVVDDTKPSARKSWIEMNQRIHCGTVHISVEPKRGEFPDRGFWQRVLEPSFEKHYLFVQKAIFSKITFDLFLRNG